MEYFELKAMGEASNPPKYWCRYGDDTGTVIKQEHSDELFQHINSQHNSIKFTKETEGPNNSIPMLELQLIREGNKIITDIYRKPTHTDQYFTLAVPPPCAD